MREQLNVTELDFETIKQNLINHFVNNSGGEFSDWDFEGSNLNVLLDVLAYNTHYNAMLAHMAVNESFIDSAQLRSSVTSAAKLLSYTPRSYSAAKAFLAGEFTSTGLGPESFQLERGTRFVTNSPSQGAFEFVVLDDPVYLDIDRSGSYYVNRADTPICLYEGRLVTRTFQANLNYTGHRYVITDSNIDINTLRVIVYPTAAKQDGAGILYHKYGADDINSGDNDPIYFINENSFGQYEISFGNGIYGKAIESGNVIEVEYLICSGARPNGIRTNFRMQSTVPLYANAGTSYISGTRRLRLIDRVGGGAEKETTDRLRENATHSFIAQNRVVTAEDYKYMIRSEFPFAESVSVWGGEDNDPPIYGKVFISVRPYQSQSTGGGTSEGEKLQIKRFLQNKRVLSIQPEIVDPAYVSIVLDILFKYDPTLLSISRSALEKKIRTELISDYNANSLNTFDNIFRHSAFQKRLDNFNSSILNSLVRVFTINAFPAIFNVNDVKTETVIDYGVPLVVDDGRAIMDVKTNYIWTEKGVQIYLADEPDPSGIPNLRNLYTYSINARGTDRIRIRNVGTIDLNLGRITFNNSMFTDEQLELKIVVIPKSNDIVGKRNLLLNINEEFTRITGSIDEISSGGPSASNRYATFNRDRAIGKII